jgi:hypothetical protein
MESLGRLILSKQTGHKTADEAVDHLLAQHHLWRPLAHLPGRAREAWHLEALPLHHAQPSHPHPPHDPQQTHPASDPHLHSKLNYERVIYFLGC